MAGHRVSRARGIALEIIEAALTKDPPGVATALEAARLGLAVRPHEPRPWERLPERDCLHCGELFEPIARNQKYCRPQHQSAAAKARRRPPLPCPRPCEQCSELYQPVRRNQRWCCRECRPGYQRQPTPEPRACADPKCARLYQPQRASSRYCCDRHQRRHYKARLREPGDD